MVPSLTAAFEGAGLYYPALAAAVAEEVDRRETPEGVVLVAHSGAGALLPAIADATAATVVGTVFVDALMPHPGRSWFDTAPAEMGEQLRGLALDGLLPVWTEWFPPGTVERLLPDPAARAHFCEELPRLPLAYFDEPAPDLGLPAGVRSAYLQLSDAYRTEADRARREGLPVTHRATHHLAVLTEPEEIAGELDGLADELAG